MLDALGGMGGGYSASSSAQSGAGPAYSGAGSVNVGGLNAPPYLGGAGAAVPLWAWGALALGAVLLLKRRRK